MRFLILNWILINSIDEERQERHALAHALERRQERKKTEIHVLFMWKTSFSALS